MNRPLKLLAGANRVSVTDHLEKETVTRSTSPNSGALSLLSFFVQELLLFLWTSHD